MGGIGGDTDVRLESAVITHPNPQVSQSFFSFDFLSTHFVLELLEVVVGAIFDEFKFLVVELHVVLF